MRTAKKVFEQESSQEGPFSGGLGVKKKIISEFRAETRTIKCALGFFTRKRSPDIIFKKNVINAEITV
jgi:hypothetical protein